ncbi:MAG: Na+/H+ antiporter subunit E [Comamonadaceae bacterium CG_4_10_14_3_um_filter_60_42]|nr:MAG: Na+/H+ antiporter subunit E [Comamonadaceae bacterium CG2_30_59_20]PIY29978.1 MAG: Na+/H+ antiporter subunit E [Comamonadaceae bacterium CG_4_10_14_3_um_filter_60_42]
MKKWLPHPLLTPILALIWLLLNNTLAPGQIVLGLLLGWAIPRFTLGFWPEQVHIYRPLSLLRFLAVFLYDVLVANVAVARLVLAGPRSLNPLFVEVPLDLTNELALSMLANTICLTPGTVSARLSPDHRTLLVHALDCTDPDDMVRTIKTRFETPLKEIFEC